MPVFIVKANAKTLAENPSWLVDLHKIYAEMLKDEAPAFIEKTLENSKAQPNCWFAGALFNDHLLGAALVVEADDVWQLSYLSVRKVTRRRGVGTRLLSLLTAQAAEKNAVLSLMYLEDTDAHAQFAVEALVAKLDHSGE